MKTLLHMIIQLLSELIQQNKQQVIPISIPVTQDRWLNQRDTMDMLDRKERQLFRYVDKGVLVSRKVGQNKQYLESSVLKLLNKSDHLPT